MTLQEEMIRFRAAHGLSQGRFAEMCKLSTQTVCSVEKGIQTPTKLTEAKIRIVIENDKKEEVSND